MPNKAIASDEDRASNKMPLFRSTHTAKRRSNSWQQCCGRLTRLPRLTLADRQPGPPRRLSRVPLRLGNACKKAGGGTISSPRGLHQQEFGLAHLSFVSQLDCFSVEICWRFCRRCRLDRRPELRARQSLAGCFCIGGKAIPRGLSLQPVNTYYCRFLVRYSSFRSRSRSLCRIRSARLRSPDRSRSSCRIRSFATERRHRRRCSRYR